MKHYDLIVLGAGAAGLNVASFANRIDLSVLLVDRTDERIGGDCLNFGCVPSKALIHASRLIATAREAKRFGVSLRGRADWERVRAYIAEVQEQFRAHENAEYFREKGMDVVLGETSFTGHSTVRVGGEEYEGRRIIIATGSRPRELSFENTDGVPVYTNETIFSAESQPQHLLIVGGGPIGFELGQALARLGTTVTIANRDERWLAKEPRTASRLLVERLEEEGVTLIPNVELREVRDGEAVLVRKDGGEEQVACDSVLVSIGRVPNLESFALERAGVELDERGGLVLDGALRTTNPHVIALGDVAGQHQFTHATEVHAALVLRNLFLPRFLAKSLDASHMGWVTFTDPEIATFGRSLEQLDAAGVRYTTIEQSFTEDDRALIEGGRARDMLWLHVTPRGRVLGGTMVARGAGELVSELMLAERHGMTLADLFARVYPYPVAARINRRAAGAFLAQSLTPLRQGLLRSLFRLW